MTPKEKAEELVDKMYYSRKYKNEEDYIPQEAWVHAKLCALIAVDEIKNALKIDAGNWIKYNETQQYWQEVKQEIELL